MFPPVSGLYAINLYFKLGSLQCPTLQEVKLNLKKPGIPLKIQCVGFSAI